MISEKQLRSAAKEMNDVMGLDPEINPKASASVLKEEILKNMEDIEEGDEFTEETQAVFDELKPKKGKKYSKKDDGEEEEEDQTEETEDENDDEEEDDDLRTEIEDAEKLSQLKTIVKEKSAFKSLREDLAAYKDVDDLRDDMIEILDKEDEEKDEKADKLHKKNIGSKKVNEVKKGKKDDDEEEEEEEEEKPKAKEKKAGGNKAPNFKKEGSMAQFMDETVKEGGTWEEIHKAIEKEAKKRGVKTSLATIKAHVKFRVSKDAKFLGKLKVREDGIS